MARKIFHEFSFYITAGMINIAVVCLLFVTNIKPAIPVYASANQFAFTPQKLEARQGKPIRLVLPSISLDTSVALGSYNEANEDWSIDDQQVYFASPSSQINNKLGNTVIYGHRFQNLFGRLKELDSLDEAIVYTDTGFLFRYQYRSFLEVDPYDTSVLGMQGPPTLVLQTCSGGWDQYRALYSFSFKSAQKI